MHFRAMDQHKTQNLHAAEINANNNPTSFTTNLIVLIGFLNLTTFCNRMDGSRYAELSSRNSFFENYYKLNVQKSHKIITKSIHDSKLLNATKIKKIEKTNWSHLS